MTSGKIPFVIHGAGTPTEGEAPTALHDALGSSWVMDWLLHAVTFLKPSLSVNFIDGYHQDHITEKYPDFESLLCGEAAVFFGKASIPLYNRISRSVGTNPKECVQENLEIKPCIWKEF